MGLRELQLSSSSISVLSNQNGKINRITVGNPTNYLAVILEGHAVFRSAFDCVEVFPNELLYIPAGCPYTSEWYGEPNCTFFSLPFSFRYFLENGTFSLQKIDDPEMNFAAVMERMYQNAEAAPAAYLADFFSLYAYVQAHFSPSPKRAEELRFSAAIHHMETHPSSDFDVPDLARICNMSESSFYTGFKNATGHTPIDYKNILRCRRATELLCNTDLTVEDIAERLGCSGASYLRRVLLKVTGKTPKQIRAEKQLI